MPQSNCYKKNYMKIMLVKKIINEGVRVLELTGCENVSKGELDILKEEYILHMKEKIVLTLKC